MSPKTILFPTDFSAASDAGLDHATALAKQQGARLLILHVAEPPAAYGGGELYYGVPEPSEDVLSEMLAKVRPTDPDVAFAHRMVTGDPAREIVRMAEDEEAELIVLGTHGRTGFLRLLMGSVAEAVVRRAKCPVLTFKQPQVVPAVAK